MKKIKKRNKLKKIKFCLLVILVVSFFYLNNYIIGHPVKKTVEISIIINLKNITKERHFLFHKIMQKLKSSRNFYFIKSLGKHLNNNLDEYIKNSSIKIVQSNFPDSVFLPLIVSLYGNYIPELVFFIEGNDIIDNTGDNLIKWFCYAYMKIINNDYDYIFGGSQIIEGKKVGCSLLLSKASVLQHLLYYTDSDTTHINPFIQLSLANKTKFTFIPFNFIKETTLENIEGKFSLNMNCQSIKDKQNPSLCIMIPAFKRDYFHESFLEFSKQTYKPIFYTIIQNDNRRYLNLSSFENLVKVPVYHIWMQNWNSFFF